MTQKTWFITGINSGLGREMTVQLLARGDTVAGTIRRPGVLDDLKAQFGDRLWQATLDLTDTQSIPRVIDKAFADLGRIDVVVNNAGYGVLGAVEELTEAQIAHQIATNLTGPILVTRAAVPHLRAQGGGRIIQISTMGGQATFPAASLYHASKWGIEGFMDSVRHELAPFGIGLTIVEPGTTGTSFGRNLIQSTPLDVYADGPVGQTRAYFGDGDYVAPGDAAKTATVIISSASQNPAPIRLATGSDAYGVMRNALTERLAALEAQKDVAFSTDV